MRGEESIRELKTGNLGFCTVHPRSVSPWAEALVGSPSTHISTDKWELGDGGCPHGAGAPCQRRLVPHCHQGHLETVENKSGFPQCDWEEGHLCCKCAGVVIDGVFGDLGGL